MYHLLKCLVCIVTATLTSAVPIPHMKDLYLRSSVSQTQVTTQLAQARYHTAFQDNFDGSNLNTWQQAYFVNDTFWRPGPDSPIFLCVGGEGPAMDGSYVVDSDHCNIAVEWLQETGALMFALEHRYYGCHNVSACPVADFTAKDALRYHSSRQALADVAHFHQYATEEYSIDPKAKWVTWGGSYPGMLAGFSRLKFPHLFHASIASSAPVHAELEMKGYYDLVAYAFTVSDNDVGGSEACSANIADGHHAIQGMFGTEEGRSTLQTLFQLPSADWLKDVENQRTFAGYGVAQFDAQSNDPLCPNPACNIKGICQVMIDDTIGNTVNRLAHVASAQSSWARMPWETILYYKRVQTSHREPTPAWYSFWDWQTCTEFGFFQTCTNGSKCFFTQGLVTLDVFTDACKQQFNIPVEKIKQSIEFSNTYYGGLTPAGTRVMYPNGEVDPWRANSIEVSPGPALIPLYVPGASHHAWTHTSHPGDQLSIRTARSKIKGQVSQWLME